MTYLMALCPSLLAIKSWQVNVCDGFDLDPLRGEHKLGAELILNTLTLGRFTSKIDKPKLQRNIADNFKSLEQKSKKLI